MNIKHFEVPETPQEYFPDFSGQSRTQCCRASVFTISALVLHPPPPAARLCVFYQVWWVAGERRTDFSCLHSVERRPCSQLPCHWTLQDALSWSVGSKLDASCIRIALIEYRGKGKIGRCTREMLVMRLFSPNKLIDYSSAFSSVRVHVLVSTRYLRTSVQQTVSRFISFVEKPLLAYEIEAGARFGAAKNETRGMSSPSIANLLRLYGKNMINTLIPAFGAPFAEHATALPSFLDLLCCVVVSWRIPVLQLFYIVHAYCISVHSPVAAGAYAHRVLFNVNWTIYNTMPSWWKMGKVLMSFFQEM